MNTYQVSYKISPECVTVTEKNTLELYITNQSDKELFLENPNHIDVAQYPAFGVPCSSQDPPGFEMKFSYGTQGGDINTKDVCKNITFSLKQGDPDCWQIGSFTNGGEQEPSWVIIPRNTVSLLPKESLVLLIENITPNALLGTSMMQVNVKSVEGIDASYIPVNKISKPVIVQFVTDKDKYDLNEDVTYSWKLQDYDPNSGARLTLDGQSVSGEKKTLKVQKGMHTLRVENPAGYYEEKTCQIAINYMAVLQVARCDSGSITLSWSTKNMRDCEITGIGKVELNGIRQYGVSKDVDIVLTAFHADSFEKETSTIQFRMPCITEFRAATHRLNKEKEYFLSLEEVLDEETQAVVAPPYAAPEPPEPPHHKKVYATWSTRNVEYCGFEERPNYTYAISGNNVEIEIEDFYSSLTLRAVGNFGYTVIQRQKL